MSSIPMRWRDWFNTARLCYELRELRQGWAQYERIHDALIGRYETKIAALESENARLKEALREVLNVTKDSWCYQCTLQYPDCWSGASTCPNVLVFVKARKVLDSADEEGTK